MQQWALILKVQHKAQICGISANLASNKFDSEPINIAYMCLDHIKSCLVAVHTY